jgi:hypothetical protein
VVYNFSADITFPCINELNIQRNKTFQFVSIHSKAGPQTLKILDEINLSALGNIIFHMVPELF